MHLHWTACVQYKTDVHCNTMCVKGALTCAARVLQGMLNVLQAYYVSSSMQLVTERQSKWHIEGEPASRGNAARHEQDLQTYRHRGAQP